MNKNGDKNADEHAKKYFQPGVAEKFHKAPFRHAAGFKEFIYNLIEDARLHSCRPAHALGIKHDNQRKGNRYRKKRIRHADAQRHRCRQG